MCAAPPGDGAARAAKSAWFPPITCRLLREGRGCQMAGLRALRSLAIILQGAKRTAARAHPGRVLAIRCSPIRCFLPRTDALLQRHTGESATSSATPKAAALSSRAIKRQQKWPRASSPRRPAAWPMPAAAALTATTAAACDSKKEDRLEALERRVAALEPRKTNPTDHWASDLLAADVLFSEHQIEQMVGSLATQISRDYAGRDVVIVGLMDGVFMFLADLEDRARTNRLFPQVRTG